MLQKEMPWCCWTIQIRIGGLSGLSRTAVLVWAETRHHQHILTLDRTGYLPAEHIELPVERSARQNKHRNIEVSHDHVL